MRPFLLLLTGVAAVVFIMDRKVSTGTGMNLSRADRIRLHRNIARAIAAANGIPAFADWAVGQAGAESDYGNSPLFAETNNPFGIKAGSWLLGKDAAGAPIVKAGKMIYLARDGKTFYRKFLTLEAAYQHLVELYRDMVPQYRPLFPLLVAGQYQAFAEGVGPIYEPLRPAKGPGSYAQLVLDRIRDARAVA